jgi:hypothetical protein
MRLIGRITLCSHLQQEGTDFPAIDEDAPVTVAAGFTSPAVLLVFRAMRHAAIANPRFIALLSCFPRRD